MNVREAVGTARAFVKELYAQEPIGEIGIEEIEYDDDDLPKSWFVTIGFIRLWDRAAPDARPEREYKTIRITDASGEVIEVKNRSLA